MHDERRHRVPGRPSVTTHAYVHPQSRSPKGPALRPFGAPARLGATVALALVAAATAVGIALAHGGDATVDVAPSRVAAGSEVTISGDDFEANDRISLSLLTATGEHRLGAVTTEDDGHFRMAVSLPADLDVRYYEVRAVDGIGDTASGFFAVTESRAAVPPAAVAAIIVAAVVAGLVWLRRAAPRRTVRPASRARDQRHVP